VINAVAKSIWETIAEIVTAMRKPSASPKEGSNRSKRADAGPSGRYPAADEIEEAPTPQIHT